MAENIKTTQVLSILPAEVTRANAAIAEVDSLKIQNISLQVGLNQANAQVATLQARVRELEAAVPPVVVPPVVIPPVVVPPVVVPPITGRTGLFVDKGKLYTKNGTEFVIRGIESMCGSDEYNAGPVAWCKMQKDFGANTISPLWQNSQANVARLTEWMNAAKSQGLCVGFNFDHIPSGRVFACRQDIVTLVNKYDNVFIELEVETGWDQTGQQWADDVKGMVKALRDAGHIHPIKVGSPDGGRSPRLPGLFGKQVLDADPKKNLLFTWQAYWDATPSAGWHYQQHNNVAITAADPTGVIEQCKRIADSGLCFLVGIDREDDVGMTVYKEVVRECDKLGLGWQHWVLAKDHIQNNNMLSGWDQRPGFFTVTAAGQEISSLLKIKSKLAVL